MPELMNDSTKLVIEMLTGCMATKHAARMLVYSSSDMEALFYQYFIKDLNPVFAFKQFDIIEKDIYWEQVLDEIVIKYIDVTCFYGWNPKAKKVIDYPLDIKIIMNTNLNA
jgi:hypothetical protein